MISISANFKEINSYLNSIPKHINTAASKTINDSLFNLRKSYLDEFPKIFETPNMSYLQKAFQIEKSTPETLKGSLFVKEHGLGKGTAFIDVLFHHVHGDERSIKKFENAMMWHGHMGRSMIAAPTRFSKRDRYGGLDGKFNSMLLSYFGKYAKGGFDATMTPKKKAKMARYGTVKGEKSKKVYKTINGVVYFIQDRTGGHLKPGIYRKSGIHGSKIEPVILFVKKTAYKKRFDFYGIANEVVYEKFLSDLSSHIDRRFK